MAWLYLLLAGALEIIWATGLKLSHGFSRPLASTVTVLAMIASFALLASAMRHLPLGTAYAVWTGIGAAGAFLVGVLWLGETLDWLRLASILLIIAGIAGLRLAEGG